jgi:sec-independent protein translocase protein TatC
VLTPPDVISQFALAIPTLALYEVSVYLVAMVERRNAAAQKAAEEGEKPEAAPAEPSADTPAQ